jgi:alkylhydroperoxidase family enzyme
MDAVLSDWTTADIPERTRAALRLLECMTLRPLELGATFVGGLREDGLDDLAIGEAANVGFHYNLINRVADAFDFPIPQGRGKARLARMLSIAGRLFKGAYATPPWIQDSRGHILPTEVARGRQHLLSADGVTAPTLRRATEAFVTAKLGLPESGESQLPAALAPYLEKLALHAYRIIDEDVALLRAAGYSDEAIYEITVVGAFAAATVGLGQLFGTLYGEAGHVS